jgi:transcriptional regulator ATRX
MAAELGVSVSTKEGRSRLAAMTADTESSDSAPVSDSSDKSEDSEEAEEAKDDAEEDSPSKGPKRRRIRKAKSITKIMLQAAAEGRERDSQRKEDEAEAVANKGKKLVLTSPAKGDKDSEDVVVPEHMSDELQPHQRVGVKFIWDELVCKGKGAILAHCMGLGKTFQSITVLQCIWQYSQQQGERPKILVLAPVNVIRNWEAEFDKWLPEPDSGLAPPIFTMVEAGALHTDRAEYLEDWTNEGGVMLMGYEQFRNLSSGRGIRKGKKHAGIKERYAKALLDPGPYMVVCDEGHILRREQSGVTQAVRGIKTQRRVVLSGTPLQNNLMEYHCMVDIVRPNLLGDGNDFKRNFVAPILNGQCIDSTPADVKKMRHRSHILNSLLKTVVDRADFKVLQPFLKPKHEFVIGMRLSALQVKLYESILKENVPTLNQDGKGVGKFVGLRLLGTYHKLAKVWTHPRVVVMQRAKNYDSMDDFIASDSEEISWSDEEDRRKKKERKKGKKSSKKAGDSAQNPTTKFQATGSTSISKSLRTWQQTRWVRCYFSASSSRRPMRLETKCCSSRKVCWFST